MAVLISTLAVVGSAGQTLADHTFRDVSSSVELDVTALQSCLENEGYPVGGVDGIFGEQTRRAVEAFQRSRGLRVDGIAGPETLSALNCEGASASIGFERPDYGRPPYYYPPAAGNNTETRSDRKRFVVIVPTTRAQKNSVLADVRSRLGSRNSRAIDSPLGSYIEAGAFPSRNLAESQSRYLRSFGLDAQVRYF